MKPRGIIFYYSATGNSRFAALSLSVLTGDEPVDIITGKNPLNPERKDFKADNFSRIGFVFPIYGWGVPPVISRFIEEISPSLVKECYLWSLCTCGDEAGIAIKRLDKKIHKLTGRHIDASFSLIMPNTYVLLPGFDVDKKETEEGKLQKAPERLRLIASKILAAEKTYDVKEGSFPGMRTDVLRPVFDKIGVFPSLWKSTADCISCGKCATHCPAGNIRMQAGRPEWGKKCFGCCACYHICPVNSVSYGKITVGKGQYFCHLKPIQK